MGFSTTPTWATKFNYEWHSQPSQPDGLKFFEKSHLRVQRDAAWKILTGDVDGDKDYAKSILDHDHGYYKDYLGHTQYSDNPNMCSGRAAQHYCDLVLLEDATPGEAFADSINVLEGFKGGHWRDKDKDKAIISNRTLVRYTSEGSIPKKKDGESTTTSSEFERVCNNAVDGIREALAGANRITGEVNLMGYLPGLDLPYNGKPDYQEGRLELKTQWDRNADTDNPTANSLPSKITPAHMLQISGYYKLSGILPRIVYANRLGYRIFEPTEAELERCVMELIFHCKRREMIMADAEKDGELWMRTNPDFSNFMWRDMNPTLLKQAKNLFKQEVEWNL